MNSKTEPKITTGEVAEKVSESVKNESAARPQTELHKARKFPSWTDLFALAGVFVLSVLAGSLVVAFMTGINEPGALGAGLSPLETLVYYLIQMLSPILFVVWQRRKLGRGNAIHLGFGQMNLPLLLWGALLLVASSVVIEPLLTLFPTESYELVTDTLGRGVWAMMSAVVCAPILEEVLFRGVIFESCRERFGGGAAVLISALLFGLIHIVPVQVINAFVVGIILGFIYLRTRSLANVMVLHALNNLLAYLTLDLEASTMSELIGPKWLYWTIYAVAAIIFIFSMVKVVATLRANRELE